MDATPPPSGSDTPQQPADVLLPRKRGKLVGRILLAFIVLAALAYAGRRYYGELDRLKTASPWLLTAMALLYVASRVPPALILRRALVALGHHLGRAETFFVLMVQYYVNMLIPRAGIGALAGYFRLRRGIPVADLGAAQLVLLTMAQFACLGIAAVACQGLLAAAGAARFDPVLAGVFAGVAVMSLVTLFLSLPQSIVAQSEAVLGQFVGRFFSRLSDASQRLGRDRRLVARAFAAHLVVLLLRTLRVQLSFWAVGERVSFAAAFVVSAAADVMFIVSITPGALGFREGGIVYAAVRVTGMNPEVAVAAALLDRIVVSGCNLVIGQLGIWRYLGGSSPAAPAAGAVAGAEVAAAADAGSSR